MTVNQSFEKLLRSQSGKRIVEAYYEVFEKDIDKKPFISILKNYLSGKKISDSDYSVLSDGLLKYNAAKNYKILTRLTEKKQQYIQEILGKNEIELRNLQKNLYNAITTKYVPDVATENGSLTATKENFNSIRKLEKVTDEFNSTFNEPYVKNLAKTMLETSNYNTAYYLASGGGEVSLIAGKKALETINARLGIDAQGNILKSGYIGRLSEMPEVTTKLRDYVTNNIVGKKSLSEFVSGFDELINGTEEIDGALIRYHNQFANDVYNQVDNAISEEVATELGLEYFIYSGTIMERTRCFCEKRNNKVFSTEDAEDWVNDPTLPQSATEPNYNPLIDLGRWNCRHSLSFISEELAMELGYNPDEAKSINSQIC